jgi:hypothetical protein
VNRCARIIEAARKAKERALNRLFHDRNRQACFAP